MRFSWLCLAGLSLPAAILADTEVLNFHLPLAPLDASVQKPRLSLQSGALVSLNISLPDEQALALDLTCHSAWTIRMSWPGSSPTRFDVKVGSSGADENSGVLRIKATQLSPTLPGVKSGCTPVHITLEPLHLSAIPHSILPTLGLLGIFGTVAGVLVRPAMALLEAQTFKEKAV